VEFTLRRVVRVTTAATHASAHQSHRYWQTRPVTERLAAVEFLRRQHDGAGARLRRVLQLVDRPRGRVPRRGRLRARLPWRALVHRLVCRM